jgi:threonyl-tRNA synthetase
LQEPRCSIPEKEQKGKKEEEPQPQAKPEEQPVEPPKQEEPKAPVNREVYPKDEWDDEEFIWEEQQLKPGFKRPCIVHRAILGSVERCLAILIEHYAGKWPFWLSPRQVCICTVNDKVGEWAEHVYLDLKLRGYQVFYDRSAATLQKKIRNAQLDQFNFVAVIGKEEVDGKCVDIRTREGDRKGKFTIDQLVAFFKTLEPSPSKLHLDLINKTQNGVSKTVLDEYEKSLEYNLYLEGDDISEKDKTVYASLKETLIEKEKYPNIFKWQKLMNASMPKQ